MVSCSQITITIILIMSMLALWSVQKYKLYSVRWHNSRVYHHFLVHLLLPLIGFIQLISVLFAWSEVVKITSKLQCQNELRVEIQTTKKWPILLSIINVIWLATHLINSKLGAFDFLNKISKFSMMLIIYHSYLYCTNTNTITLMLFIEQVAGFVFID